MTASPECFYTDGDNGAIVCAWFDLRWLA